MWWITCLASRGYVILGDQQKYNRNTAGKNPIYCQQGLMSIWNLLPGRCKENIIFVCCCLLCDQGAKSVTNQGAESVNWKNIELNIYMIDYMIIMRNISKLIVYISKCLAHRNPMIYDATGSVDHAAQWNLLGAAFGNKADLLRIGWQIAGLQSLNGYHCVGL